MYHLRSLPQWRNLHAKHLNLIDWDLHLIYSYRATNLQCNKLIKLPKSITVLSIFIWCQMFFQPVHEALDTKFLKVNEGIYSRENLKRRFFLRALLFIGNTIVTAAIPFMGDFINLLGSFTLVTLTFIFPSMIFIKVIFISAKDFNRSNNNVQYNMLILHQ